MCCAASCAAPCATPSCSARREPLMWRLVPALTREMGQAYPELIRAEALIAETLRLEETRFRATLARGLAILDEETRDLARRRQARRRDRLQALRHLRLSARPDAGRAARARPRRRRRRLRRGDGAPARRGAQGLGGLGRGGDRDGLVRLARAARRDRVPRLRDRDRRGRGRARSSRTAPRSSALEAGEKGSLILNQTPFYGESGGQVGDTGVMLGAGLPRRASLDTQKKLGDLFVHEVEVEEGALQVGAWRWSCGVDHAARSAHPRQSFGDPSAARGVAHGARRPCRAEGLARRARPPALRHRPSQADHRPRSSPRSRTSPIASSCRTQPVTTRLMGARRGARLGRARAVRREIRRRGARRRRWGRSRAATTAARPIRSNSAAAPMSRAPATSASSRSSARARSPPACAASRRRPATRRASGSTRMRARSPISPRCLRAPAAEAGERLDALLEETKKLERELADARRKLAMGGGASDGATPCATSRGVKFYARAVTGVEMKDLKSLADEAKAERRLRRRRDRRAPARTARRASSSASRRDLTARFNAVDLVRARLGGARRQGRRRPSRHGAGRRPGRREAAEALAAVEEGIRRASLRRPVARRGDGDTRHGFESRRHSRRDSRPTNRS